MDKLLKLPVETLFQKFGAGNHKPGSGSASAFQGMLSAQMIHTVISLTTDEKRRASYQEFFPRIEMFKSEIENRIYPELVRLFQEDSEQFDKAIRLRQARDSETDVLLKEELDNKALIALKPATEIPIEIAKLSIELADFAAFLFDKGFRSARGDSGVALSSAISVITSCLSIIELNRSYFPSDEWTEKIKSQVDILKTEYLRLSTGNFSKIEVLSNEADEKNGKKLYHSDMRSFHYGPWDESNLSYTDIEKIARQLQNTLWKHRNMIWKGNAPINAMDILKPAEVLKTLGYEFSSHTTLGQHNAFGVLFEIAAVIDQGKKSVYVSEAFPPEVRNFTAAHELGHALLHKELILHRDRALDGSNLKGRNLQELQADKFASYFLMPQIQVRKKFQKLFLTDKLVINQDTVYDFNEFSVETFRAKCKNLRGFARYIASTGYFRDGYFTSSISKTFHVSVEAMAIRLEELNLIEF